jgi:DNA mismatch repair protein MSH4
MEKEVADFIHCHWKKRRTVVECQTITIVQLNQRITNALDEATLTSDELVTQLLENLREYSSDMFQVCESIGLLDMVASFSHVVTIHSYVRPETADELCILSGRHPILDQASAA